MCSRALLINHTFMLRCQVRPPTSVQSGGNYKKDFSSQIDAIEANHSTDYDPKKSFTKTQGRFPNVKTSKKDDSRSNNKKPFDTSNKNR